MSHFSVLRHLSIRKLAITIEVILLFRQEVLHKIAVVSYYPFDKKNLVHNYFLPLKQKYIFLPGSNNSLIQVQFPIHTQR